MSQAVPLIVMAVAAGLLVWRTVTGRDRATRDVLALAARNKRNAPGSPSSSFRCGFDVVVPGRFSGSLGSSRCLVGSHQLRVEGLFPGAFVFNRSSSSASWSEGRIKVVSEDLEIHIRPVAVRQSVSLLQRHGWATPDDPG
jgi:hypothetical protein